MEDGLTDLPGTMTPALEFAPRICPSGPVALGEGHAQLREMVSAMRMRSFSGRYHIIVPEGDLYRQTWRLLNEFWQLLPYSGADELT